MSIIKIGTHWIAFYANKNHITYFDSFRVEYILEEIKKFIGNKDVTANIYRYINTYRYCESCNRIKYMYNNCSN